MVREVFVHAIFWSFNFVSNFKRKKGKRGFQYFGVQKLWLVGGVAGERWPGGFWDPKMVPCLICIQLLIYQPLLPRHTASTSLLSILGICICHIKKFHLQRLTVLPLVPSVLSVTPGPNGTTDETQDPGNHLSEPAETSLGKTALFLSVHLPLPQTTEFLQRSHGVKIEW